MDHRELFVALQRLPPKHALSRFIAKLAQSKNTRLKNALINRAIKTFDISMDEAISDDLTSYIALMPFYPAVKADRPSKCRQGDYLTG